MARVIIEDTRQQAGKHGRKHKQFERMGIELVRSKLYVGDYAEAGSIVCVDTKKDIYEIHGNLMQGHTAFRDECDRAVKAGYGLIVLVETTSGVRNLDDLAKWVEPMPHYMARKKKVPHARRWGGKTLACIAASMEQEHGVRFRFCGYEETAQKILDYLEWGKQHGPWWAARQ